MTQYLVFDNQKTGGIGTQKELVVNWSNINYIKEVSTSSFKLRLNSGAELTFSVSTGTSKAIIDSIQSVIRSQANGRILKVKPTSINAFQLSGITYTGTLLSVPSAISNFNSLFIGSSPSNTSGRNTGYGWSVMSSISNSAQYNVAMGQSCLQYCNGDSNVAMGYDALKNHYDGTYNIAIGYDCMSKSGFDEGSANNSNVIIGAQAGRDINEGCSNNVGVGRSTLGNLNQNGSPGSSNTAVGHTAGNGLFSGDNNTLLGNDADPSTVNVSNEFVLGNSSVAVLRCAQGSISALSDERDKTSVEDLPYGLDFVDSLKPKRFVWDNRPETKLKINDKGEKIEVEVVSANKGKKDIGFIAQELQTVDDEFLNLVYDSNPEKLEASYSKLIPVLVKAIQELKAELDKKQDK
jgi:hypothetical protein